MIFKVKMEGIFKAAALYTIPCHNTGHINVMLVLQSCTDSLQVLPGSSNETFPTPSDGTCDVSNTAVQQDVVVVEEHFIAVNKEAPIGIKQEEIPEDISFPDIKSEPDEVSYVCVCLLLDTFYQYPGISVVFVTSIFLAS
jgi:hypothetical protein